VYGYVVLSVHLNEDDLSCAVKELIEEIHF
jgi:hypothetical protein